MNYEGVDGIERRGVEGVRPGVEHSGSELWEPRGEMVAQEPRLDI